jgi:hypothetical protein
MIGTELVNLATGNEKALDLLRQISPAAWQHLHFLEHWAYNPMY